MRFEANIHGPQGTRTVKLTSDHDAVSVLEQIAGEQLQPGERVGQIVRVKEQVGPAVEVVPMRAGVRVGKFYVVTEASNTIAAGPFDTAGEAAEHRGRGQHVSRECA